MMHWLIYIFGFKKKEGKRIIKQGNEPFNKFKENNFGRNVGDE